MPDGKKPITNFNPNEFKVVNKNKTVTDFNPNEFKIVGQSGNFFSPKLREGDVNVITPKYATPKDIEVESAINFIKEQGGRNKTTLLDSELDVLRDVLKDSRATQEQKKKAILTIQGYDDKHDDNNTMYYMKKEDNGVYMPTALAYGEKPPKGYKVASIWGNEKEAEDDSWWQDLSKSFANGVLGAAQGVIDLTQVGTTLATGEESKYLNKLSNTAEALKFKKDTELDTPILNTEGITQWSDLLDKDRFDLSPKALWGSLNMAAESLTEFGGGAKGAVTALKSGKGFAQGLKGIGKEFIDDAGVVHNAISLSDKANKAAIFTGSFVSQLGDNLDTAESAGLKGRDKAAVASAITAPMAALDAFWGLDGKLMSTLFQNEKRNLLKNVIKSVEKDAAGNITENGFKQLTKEMTIGYSELAKKGVKEITKDVLSEGSQEAAQDFVQKAGEQLWDKMTPDERGQFGTDAFNAKSFGEYINSFAQGLVGGAPMSVGTNILRKKHDEQSLNAYERVKQGPEAVKALKVDLDNALKNNDINQSEYDQAIFKIDSYDKYHQETKNVNLKPEDEKKAFELSFQIQGLKTEIPTNENEISKLDPIARAKVESKQKQAKELQSELNDIIRRGEIKGEPVVPKKEEERIQKEKEKEIKTEETNSKLSQEEPVVKEKEVVKKGVIVQPKLSKQPHWKDDTRSYDDVDVDTFNNQAFDARSKFRMVVEKLDKEPSKEASALLIKRPYKYWDGEKWKTGDVIEAEFADGKRIRTASSKKLEAGYRGWFRQERTLGNEEGLPVGVKVIDLNNPRGEQVGEDYVPGRKILKIYDKRTGKFLSWAKETKLGKLDALDKNDQILTTQEQGEFIKTLEQLEYNEKPSDEGEISEIIKPKPKPTPTEKAAEATEQIVKESKEKVKQEKQKQNQENVIKTEVIEDKKTLALKIKRKVEGYNRLSFNQKKTDFGVNLRNEIDKDVKEFGGSLKPLNRKNIQLLDSEGKQVKKDSVKREQSVIDNEKAIALKKKNALNTTPTSIHQYIAMVIGAKGQFDESITKEIPNVPSMMKDFKKGYTLESLLQGYRDRANLTDESINESYFNSEAMDFLKEYLIEGGRDLAIKYAIESYEKEVNGGYTDKQIKELEDYARSNGITEEELSDINEVAQNVNEEEYKAITEKIESKNENERNEQLADEITTDYFGDENGINDVFIKNEGKKSGEEKDITRNESEGEPFQKESQRKGDFSKVFEKIKANFKGITVVEDSSKFTGEQSTVAGKVSEDGKFIYINPNYAGLDTPIHEAGHILIDAMGYNNKVIQSAIKQLRTTTLYTETKERYKELSEQELDKEVLAEAIGREGADIFDKEADRSKFKAYLDYIFDWLKQKLGLDKNVAKSLAKQIIGGIKTKELKGTEIGKEQLQKEKSKKEPFKAQALKYNQYAMEEGFDAQKEFDKYQQAYVDLKEAKLEEKEAELQADEAMTDEEVKLADERLEQTRKELKEASKEFAIKGKKYLDYLKYKKDFKAVQAILEDKDLDEYTYKELNDLIVKLYSFNDKAAKSVKERAYVRLGHKSVIEQQKVSKGKEGVIEALAKTQDIGPLASKILHISHFSENHPSMQAVALASGNAIIDKLSEANALKDTHQKLALKVIKEENNRLGITGSASNRFSSDSAKYFDWMIDKDGNYLTVKEAEDKGLSQAKINYLKFHRETVNGYRNTMSANDFENAKMAAIRVDKGFREAYKSEGLIPAFSYYLGGGATNLGRVRILHNGKVMSYSEIEKEIIAGADRNSIKSMAKALFDLLVANIKARYQLKKGQNVDESTNPLELKGDAEYSLNEKGQLVSKFDKPRAADRGYSKDFYKAMNQFIDESAHVKHISKIMPLVDAVEYLNKNGYMEEGYVPKKNVAKWMEDWKALHIFKEPHVNDPVIDGALKTMRKLVASTTMWFNIPANTINVFIGNYNNWRAENAETLVRGNARLFGGKGSRKEVGVVNDYALGIIKKYNLVNQDFDSHPVIKAGSVFSKLATFGTQLGEYQIQGSLALGLMPESVYNSFEYTKDKYGNDVLTVKEGVNEDDIKKEILKVKNRVTDIQGKYPDEDRRNIMRGEFGKALFQFKVWMPDWFKERFGARYINAYGVEKEGSYRKLLRVGVKEMAADLKKGDIKKALTNPAFVTNLKGMVTIGALLALKNSGDDDEEKKKGSLNWDNMLSQVLFIFDLEQDKYMVSNPAAVLGKLKDLLNAFEALVGFEEDAWQKTKRVIPGNKAITFGENLIK